MKSHHGSWTAFVFTCKTIPQHQEDAQRRGECTDPPPEHHNASERRYDCQAAEG
jgi:hypothetical protein